MGSSSRRSGAEGAGEMSARTKTIAFLAVLAAGACLAVTASCGRSILAQEAGAIWSGHAGGVTGVAYLPGGAQAVSCSLDGTLKLWDAGSGRPLKDLAREQAEIFALSVDSAGRVIAATGYDGRIRIIDPKAGSSRRLTGLRGWSADVALSPDGRRVAAWSMDGDILVFDVATGNPVHTLKGQPKKWGMALAWSPDGKILAAGRIAILLWDVESGQAVRTLEGHRDFVRSLAFSPDGKKLASASMDKSIRIWEVKTGREALVLKPEGFAFSVDGEAVMAPIALPATAAAFSPDGKTLATGGADRVVRLWDTEAGSLKKELKGHRNAVMALAFSPDGTRLISAALDHTIRSWDVN
jgi:WD40 repeat protein